MRHVWLIASRELSDVLGARSLFRFAIFAIVIPVTFLAALRVQAARPATGPDQRVDAARAFFVYLDLLPTSLAMTVAATAFAVEFESGTIVPLLAAPVRTHAVFWGKCFAALTIGSTMAWVGQGILWSGYRTAVGMPWPLDIGETLPLLAVAPVFMLPPVAAAILMGSRTRRVRAAQASISMISIPLIIGSVLLALRLRTLTVGGAWPGLVVWTAVAVGLIAVGIRRWNREELLGRVI